MGGLPHALANDSDHQVVDVRAGWARPEETTRLPKEGVGVVAQEGRVRVEAGGAAAPDSGACDDPTRRVGRTVAAIGRPTVSSIPSSDSPAASANSELRPPMPSPRTVTVVSPP